MVASCTHALERFADRDGARCIQCGAEWTGRELRMEAQIKELRKENSRLRERLKPK